MSEQQANQAQDDQPFFNIQRIYLKDLSLEQPNSPAIFLEQEAPGVEVQVDVSAAQLGEDVFEVVVTGTVTTFRDAPQIAVEDVSQIEIVGK